MKKEITAMSVTWKGVTTMPSCHAHPQGDPHSRTPCKGYVMMLLGGREEKGEENGINMRNRFRSPSSKPFQIKPWEIF
jgi:hypothetical protein